MQIITGLAEAEDVYFPNGEDRGNEDRLDQLVAETPYERRLHNSVITADTRKLRNQLRDEKARTRQLEDRVAKLQRQRRVLRKNLTQMQKVHNEDLRLRERNVEGWKQIEAAQRHFQERVREAEQRAEEAESLHTNTRIEALQAQVRRLSESFNDQIETIGILRAELAQANARVRSIIEAVNNAAIGGPDGQ